MGILSKALIGILVLVALNALAYGTSFVISPEQGLGEFGYDTSGTIDDGAIFLVSLVGIGMLGFMGFAILAIVLLLKRNRNGLAVTLVLGGTYLAIGIYWFSNQVWMDAMIYGGFGALISLLSGLLWKSMAPGSVEAQP